MVPAEHRQWSITQGKQDHMATATERTEQSELQLTLLLWKNSSPTA